MKTGKESKGKCYMNLCAKLLTGSIFAKAAVSDGLLKYVLCFRKVLHFQGLLCEEDKSMDWEIHPINSIA